MKSIGIDTGASFTRFWDGKHKVLKLRTPRTYNQYLHLLYNKLKVYGTINNLVVALPALIEQQQIVKGVNLGSDWERKDIKADIRSLLLVTGEILILQDTEAAGYAVQKQELDDLEPTLLITLSTGVGGALVTRNSVLPLEIGHMPLNLNGNNDECECGQHGCVEVGLSGTGIYKRLGIYAESLEDNNFWSNYGAELGQLFLALSSLFKLRQIVLIGGVSQRYPLFLKQTKAYLASNLKLVPIPTIRISQLGDSAGVYGAYWRATYEENP